MLTRSYWVKYHLAAGFQSAIRQLLSLRLPLKQKQGIGIIFIADYFATCFALRVGPTRDCDHFDIRS